MASCSIESSQSHDSAVLAWMSRSETSLLKGSVTFSFCKCPWVLEKTKVSQVFFYAQFYLFLGQEFYDSGDSFLFLNAKGSKFWVQTIIFTMKYIEIRKSFI